MAYCFINYNDEIIAFSKTMEEQGFEDETIFKNYLIEDEKGNKFAISSSEVKNIAKVYSTAITNFEPYKYKYIEGKIIENESFIDPLKIRLQFLKEEYHQLMKEAKQKFGEDFVFDLNEEEE